MTLLCYNLFMNGNIPSGMNSAEAFGQSERRTTLGELGASGINHFDLGEQRRFLDGILERANVEITLDAIPTVEPV